MPHKTRLIALAVAVATVTVTAAATTLQSRNQQTRGGPAATKGLVARQNAQAGTIIVTRAGSTAETPLTRPRHRAALQEATGWLAELDEATLPELRAEALRAAVRALGRITGQVGVEAVLDSVFTQFCIGK